MKILYRQSPNGEKEASKFSLCGIYDCYFKYIKCSFGDGNSAKRRHSHKGFEFHIMVEGSQCYESDSGIFMLDEGRILAVPKDTPHSMVSATIPMVKYAFTFSVDEDFYNTEKVTDCVLFPATDRILSNIKAVEAIPKDAALRDLLVESIVFETVYLLLSEIGVSCRGDCGAEEEIKSDAADERVELAVQFIKDNIESPLQVCEVASYCYISEKQLNRLFADEIGQTVSSYIRNERLKRMEWLLSTTRMSLSQISEKFGFPSEHGFNVFFKKHNGMPPGEYRKMTKNVNSERV